MKMIKIDGADGVTYGINPSQVAFFFIEGNQTVLVFVNDRRIRTRQFATLDELINKLSIGGTND
jgi:hypothetical protein